MIKKIAYVLGALAPMLPTVIATAIASGTAYYHGWSRQDCILAALFTMGIAAAISWIVIDHIEGRYHE